jgi:hypothetical protein
MTGFTLAELLVSVGVLILLVLLATQLLNSAATITTLGHKQMDADSQTRQLLDRMAIDFAQMVKRSDVDYFAKGTAAPNSVGGTMAGNDQIAFYSTVPGYYPVSGSQSPVSLVAYRVNSTFNRMERLGKGLVWNAVSTTDTPVVFLPLLIANKWPYATNQTPDPSSASAYETVGSQVFRFEYFYLLRGQSDPGITPSPAPFPPMLSTTPWDTRINSCCPVATPIPSATPTPTPTATPTPTPPIPSLCCHNSSNGMQDVAAIVVDIAVIDPKSKLLVSNTQLATLSGASGASPVLVDYTAGMTPGSLLAQWRTALDTNTIGLPRPAISGIRLYERCFYLSPPTLITP